MQWMIHFNAPHGNLLVQLLDRYDLQSVIAIVSFPTALFAGGHQRSLTILLIRMEQESLLVIAAMNVHDISGIGLFQSGLIPQRPAQLLHILSKSEIRSAVPNPKLLGTDRTTGIHQPGQQFPSDINGIRHIDLRNTGLCRTSDFPLWDVVDHIDCLDRLRRIGTIQSRVKCTHGEILVGIIIDHLRPHHQRLSKRIVQPLRNINQSKLIFPEIGAMCHDADGPWIMVDRSLNELRRLTSRRIVNVLALPVDHIDQLLQHQNVILILLPIIHRPQMILGRSRHSSVRESDLIQTLLPLRINPGHLHRIAGKAEYRITDLQLIQSHPSVRSRDHGVVRLCLTGTGDAPDPQNLFLLRFLSVEPLMEDHVRILLILRQMIRRYRFPQQKRRSALFLAHMNLSSPLAQSVLGQHEETRNDRPPRSDC